MSDGAAHAVAHAVDRLLPHVPIRQWVMTYPRQVRYHLAADPRLATEALQLFIRTLFNYQRAAARAQGLPVTRARSSAALTYIQRFGSALQANLHFHSLLPDGIFVHDPQAPGARPGFAALPSPTDEEVARLCTLVASRTLAMLRRRGRLEDDTAGAPDPGDHLLAMAHAPVPGTSRTFVPTPSGRLCAQLEGFSLHAARRVHEHDRDGPWALVRVRGAATAGERAAVAPSQRRRSLPDETPLSRWHERHHPATARLPAPPVRSGATAASPSGALPRPVRPPRHRAPRAHGSADNEGTPRRPYDPGRDSA
jgi:hypothetical protein